MSQFSPPPTGSDTPAPRTSVMAIASLVLGLLGCIPFLTGLLATVFGVLGLRATRNPRVTGKGMAIAGLILGVLSLGGWSLLVMGGLAVWNSTRPARQVADDFTRDVAAGRIDAALARTEKDAVDREALIAAQEQMKPWGTYEGFDTADFNAELDGKGERFKVGGAVRFSQETRRARFTVIRDGEAYKIRDFHYE